MAKDMAQAKSDASANWARAVSFVPKKGEIVVYSDLNKIKIGDGETKLADLPFMSSLRYQDNVLYL